MLGHSFLRHGLFCPCIELIPSPYSAYVVVTVMTIQGRH